MRRFIYQYNGNSATREYESVADDAAPPKVGDKIKNLEWVVESATPIHKTTAATANIQEKRETRLCD